jgi:hypothetical protein
MQLRQELRLLACCSEISSDDLISPNFPARKSRSAETISDLLGWDVAVSCFETRSLPALTHVLTPI